MKFGLCLVFLSFSLIAIGTPHQEIEIQSSDGLTLKADLYLISPDAPFILLCHQARYSRGEYREIAPNLNAMGFNCLAIDQRSGDEVNSVKNSIADAASAKLLGTQYPDALPDVLAALDYIKVNYPGSRRVMWGSSYSAALTFVVASKTELDAIVAFSPGEYFEIDGKSIGEYAAATEIPVFVTSSKAEASDLKDLYNKIPGSRKFMFTPEGKGKHGSKALWADHEGAEEYWVSVKKFLREIRQQY